MAKTEKLLSKVVMIAFLVLLVLGFTLPGVINFSNPESTEKAEPRLCSSDADCYLICDNEPVAVLCSQNLCLQNSCEENSYYPYDANPITFTILVQNVSLEERSNSQDFFVKFNGNTVQLFTARLVLYQVLEKARLILDTQCLAFDGKQYCGDEISMVVNGENSTLYGNYAPEKGDVVEIKYW